MYTHMYAYIHTREMCKFISNPCNKGIVDKKTESSCWVILFIGPFILLLQSYKNLLHAYSQLKGQHSPV